MIAMAAFRLPTGRLVAIGTNRTRNALSDATTNVAIQSWKGKEITTACLVGSSIACAALDGVLYVVDERGVQTIRHEDTKAWFYAGLALSESCALFGGGNGRLLELDLKTNTLVRSGLGAHGVPRPGRSILAMSDTEPRILAGAKELVLRYVDGQWQSVIAPSKRETMCQGAVVRDGHVWVIGTSNGANVLLEVLVTGGEPTLHALPFRVGRAGSIGLYKDSLLLVGDRILLGWPGSFREVALPGEDDVIAVFPDETRGTALLVGYAGHSREVSLD